MPMLETRGQSNRRAPERQPGLLSYGNTTSYKTDKAVRQQSQTWIFFCFQCRVIGKQGSSPGRRERWRSAQALA
jgi:hypothetical protein